MKRFEHSAPVTPGTPDVVVLPSRLARPAVAVHPGGGGTLLVEFTLSSVTAVQADVARWLPWPYGAVAAPTSDVILGPVSALRCTAAAAAGNWEVLG